MDEGILSERVYALLEGYGFRRLDLRKCVSEADFIAFSEALDEAVDHNPHGPYVNKQPPEKLLREGATPFLSEDETAGVAVWPDGDIRAVFKNHKAPEGAVIGELILTALSMGGRKLDCFDGELRALYAAFGFIPVARMRFDENQAPDNWKTKFGKPDVIFWMHCGDTVEDVAQKFVNFPNDPCYPDYPDAYIRRLPCFDDYRKAGKFRDKVMKARRLAAPQ